MNRTDAVVCGIDPALGVTGYAVLKVTGEVLSVVDAGVCRADAGIRRADGGIRRTDHRRSLASRLVDIDRDVSAVLNEHMPDVVAVEELYAHYRHPRTAILMGHARGVILLAAARLGIELRSYAATRIKRHLTGNGRATKAQMQRTVQTTLGLDDLPEPHDVADALAIAMCCASDRRTSRATEVLL